MQITDDSIVESDETFGLIVQADPAVKDWLGKRRIETHYINPGSPWQNPFNESFNSIFRTTCLNR